MTTPRMKCLVVDDLEENLLALSALLDGPTIEILTAQSGSQALELLLVNDVGLALLDVQMPEMDGFELAEMMRGSERTRRIPIIFVTAGSWDQLRQFKGYDAGAVDFLYKPIDPHILRSKIDVFVELYQQRQLLARELAERTEALRVNEMFTAVLGHDLRTPLAVILASAEAVQCTTQDETLRRAAERILNSGLRMSRLISNVLDLARTRAPGGMSLQREPTDLAALVERSVVEHQTIAPDYRFEVDVGGDPRGHWDPSRLAQVVANLIGNALQHGDRAAPARIQLEGTDPQQVTLRIANAGRLPAQARQRMFDPFGPRGETRGANEGLGLGLYIVDQIIRAHGGSITVSTPDDATVEFIISIPR